MRSTVITIVVVTAAITALASVGAPSAVIVGLDARSALAQQCVPGSSLTAEQTARRQEGMRLTRIVNNLQVNQPGNATRKYLRQQELATSPFATRQTGASAEFFNKLNFTPGEELLPGWELTLDVTSNGYWFMVTDKTDPCHFAFVSNQKGVIFEAQPLR